MSLSDPSPPPPGLRRLAKRVQAAGQDRVDANGNMIAAAERLAQPREFEQKEQIELYVARGCKNACKFVFRRELGR